MQIETYEIEEIQGSEASTMAADVESIALIEKLGLKGQQELCNPETLTRFPYPRLTKSQEAIFGLLFPEKTAVADYRDGIIPLRILQVAAFCREMPQTRFLQVWHSASAKDDPILIGSKSEYNQERYLLARWGDALLTFDELRAKAVPIAKAKLGSEIQKAMAKLSGFVADLDNLVTTFLDDGSKPHWNIYD